MILHERLTHRFTQNYRQPDSYHFCMETIIAAEVVASRTAPKKIADIGTGCGVFGLELLHNFPQAELDGFEIQDAFKDFFQANSAENPATAIRFHHGDVRSLAFQFSQQFDLVVANLPFFEIDQGQLSDNSMKNSCRFFQNGSASELLAAMALMMAPGAKAFVLCRPQPLQRALIPAELEIVSQTQIRRSLLVEYSRA